MTTQEALAKCHWVHTRLMEHKPEATELIKAARLAVAVLEGRAIYEETALDAANIKSGK